MRSQKDLITLRIKYVPKRPSSDWRFALLAYCT